MARVYGSPFKIDWNDLEAVKVYARKLGRGMTVFKIKGRSNYNITHTACPERYAGAEVLFRT